jgi:hypothetical protein
MPTRQYWKVGNRVQTPNWREFRNQQNMICELLQLMKECESIEVMRNPKMRIRRKPKVGNRVQMSNPTVICND